MEAEAQERYKELEKETLQAVTYEECIAVEKSLNRFKEQLTMQQYKALFGKRSFTECLLMKIKWHEWRRDHPDGCTTATG